MSGDRILAPTASLEGLLQRGLGRGYLRALEAPKRDVERIVLRCIRQDPRCDNQIDSRDDYYARLILARGVDLAPIGRFLRDSDDADESTSRAWLPIETLGELARRGRWEATRALREYVRVGTWWETALFRLGEVSDRAAWARLDAVLRKRFPDDEELRKVISYRSAAHEPWRSWRRSGPLQHLLAQAESAPQRMKVPRENLTALSTSELIDLGRISTGRFDRIVNALARRKGDSHRAELRRMAREADPGRASLAIQVLGLQGDASIIQLAQRILAGLPKRVRGRRVFRARVFRGFEGLPATALVVAREWRSSRQFGLRHAAEILLQRHATPDDVPWIRQQLTRPVSMGYPYGVCCLAEMLCRFPRFGRVSELERLYPKFSYSFGRRFLVRAMRVTDPSFPERFATECLFDCEPTVRIHAAEVAHLTDAVARARLQEMAADPFEDEDVRETAMRRLAK